MTVILIIDQEWTRWHNTKYNIGNGSAAKMIIREATISDATGIAKVHVDCWRTTYKNIIPAEVLKRLSYEQRTELWKSNISSEDDHQVYVVENEKGEISGFVSGGPEKSGEYPPYEGEVTAMERSLSLHVKWRKTPLMLAGGNRNTASNLFVADNDYSDKIRFCPSRARMGAIFCVNSNVPR
ncbi:UNVERIFIED_CONTAM: hypothetical protein ABIC26_004527 [Paenibacillus sp. PvR008]